MSAALQFDVRNHHFKLTDGGHLQAIDRLTFSLPANSFTCIVGPSGCGKTTTLRLILGLDKACDGCINIPEAGVVAAVFQEPRLLPWRTVEQNIRLVLTPDRNEESLDALLQALGIEDVRSLYPRQLSLGLARRAALARAFVLQPTLLILDEPFVSLDEVTASRLRGLLMDLWQASPTTALMVTHNEAEAASLADRILVFSERPARLLGTVEIQTPQDQRNEGTVLEICQQISACRAAME